MGVNISTSKFLISVGHSAPLVFQDFKGFWTLKRFHEIFEKFYKFQNCLFYTFAFLSIYQILRYLHERAKNNPKNDIFSIYSLTNSNTFNLNLEIFNFMSNENIIELEIFANT